MASLAPPANTHAQGTMMKGDGGSWSWECNTRHSFADFVSFLGTVYMCLYKYCRVQGGHEEMKAVGRFPFHLFLSGIVA